MEINSGGTAAMADNRYRNVLMAQQLGRPVTPEDQAFKKAYEKQKELVPTAKFNLTEAASMGKTGYAYDPQGGQTVLTSGGEAQQKGYVAFRPVKEGDIRKDTQDSKILNDVALKSNNVIKAAKALDDPDQRNIIAQAITFADKDEQFRLGLWGSQLPTAFLNALGNSGVMRGATQQTKDYVVALLSLREASMGMQRLLTGTARSNESQIAALQATLPGLEPNSALALQKMKAFTQNLDMLRQGLPTLPGITSVPIVDIGAQQGNSNNLPTISRPLSDLLNQMNVR